MPKIKQELITNLLPVKKKRDRFNGKTEEEVLEMTLPDHLVPGLDLVIIGINPGLTAAYIGHHYAGPGNHFWKCLHLSGLIPEPMNAYDDAKLKEFGIGFTNIVSRTSRGSSDLTRKEIKEGAEILLEKIKTYQPKIAVFNGKGIYEVFCGHKNFFIGKQPQPFPGTNTAVFVMPSSSARCSQLPRAVDKIPFYSALKKLRDHLRGDMPHVEESELVFPDLDLKVEPKKEKLEREAVPEVAPVNPKTPVKRGRKRKVKSLDEDAVDDQSQINAEGLVLCPSSNVSVKEEPLDDGPSGLQSHWMYTRGTDFNYSGHAFIKQEPNLEDQTPTYPGLPSMDFPVFNNQPTSTPSSSSSPLHDNHGVLMAPYFPWGGMSYNLPGTNMIYHHNNQ